MCKALLQLVQGIASVPQTMDNAEVGSFNPNVHAYYAVNPHGPVIAVTRVVGITQVGVAHVRGRGVGACNSHEPGQFHPPAGEADEGRGLGNQPAGWKRRA
jgi:hypothetical protein